MHELYVRMSDFDMRGGAFTREFCFSGISGTDADQDDFV